jgi:hypothetical protein
MSQLGGLVASILGGQGLRTRCSDVMNAHDFDIINLVLGYVAAP